MTDPYEDIDDDALDRVLDRGFRAAGDAARRDDPPSTPSVIDRIGEVTGSRPKVSLRDAEKQGQTPMLKPLGPDDVRDAGKYVIHGEIGSGGVGAVHKGHDQNLGRDVAMKLLHDKYKGEPAVLQRFVEEAQIGGQLQHPGIVPVYDLGMVGDKPFFAMKLVKGETLAKKLADRESATDDRRTFLAIFEDVCQTLAYAHARGVVHRDLKPANIMIGSFGEVQVVDWGMGKVLQSGGVHDEKLAAERQPQLSVIETVRSEGHGTKSVIGSVMGTPAYMPPEQASGDVERMDERSDVFALGAILCEILTGQPPYVGKQDELIGRAAMADLDDAHARLAACGGEPEMVDLTRRCLMPAPAARPRSAEVVAKAVHEHLAAVESRVHEARVEAAEAKVRAAALKRTQTLGISLTAVIAAGLVVSLWFWRAADTAATNEGIARAEAVASAIEAQANERVAVEQTEVAERELGRALEIKRLITEMLESVTPEQAKGADVTLLRGILDTASKRLTEDAIEDDLVAAELHALTGEVYWSIGLYQEAEQHLPVAVELRERALGEEHPDTLSSLSNLANLYRVQGRHAEAEPLLLSTLAVQESVLGEEHPDTLSSRARIAAVYHGQGRHTETLTLQLPTLETQKRVLGEEHPNTLSSMANLAAMYVSLGRHADAETVYLQTLEINKRVLGEEHPDTLHTMGNLATIYQLRGRYAEAETVHRQTLEIKERVLGEEHPSTLKSMINLVLLYSNQGRFAEAESIGLETLELHERVWGEEHAHTLEAMSVQAGIYLRQARYDEAESLLLDALEVQVRTLGKEHPSALITMSLLVDLYALQGRGAEGATLGLETLEIQERVQGEEHTNTVRTMFTLANLYMRQGRNAEAEPLLRRTLEISTRTRGAEHPNTLSCAGNLAIVYQWQGKHAEAEPLMLQTLEIMKRVLGEEHPDTQAVMQGLAILFLAQGRSTEAEPLLLRTLELQTRVLGEEHPDRLGTLTNLGAVYNSMERFEEAAEMLEISLPIKRRVLGPRHAWTANAMQGLARAYLGLGRRDDAESLWRDLLERQTSTADAPGAPAAALNAVAWTLVSHEMEELREPGRALDYAERACQAEEAAGGANLWMYLDTLARAQHMNGDSATAFETQSRAIELMPSADADPEMRDRQAEYEAAGAESAESGGGAVDK